MQPVRSTRTSSITNFVPISRPFSKLTAEGTFLLYLTGGKHNTSARWKARVQNTSNFRVFFCALSTRSVLLVLDSGHCCCCWWWWCNPQRVLTKRSKLDNDEKKNGVVLTCMNPSGQPGRSPPLVRLASLESRSGSMRPSSKRPTVNRSKMICERERRRNKKCNRLVL